MTEAQEKLVLENQGLIGLAIKKLGMTYRYEELSDVSIVGLVKGAKNFDKTKGFKASTYLYSCIKTEIYNYLRFSNTRKRGRSYQTISLEQEVCIGDRNVCVSDLIADEKVNIEESIIRCELINKIYEKINKLTDRDKNIICHSFGILGFKKMNQREIASELKISQVQVSRIIQNRLKKIRRELKDYD